MYREKQRKPIVKGGDKAVKYSYGWEKEVE